MAVQPFVPIGCGGRCGSQATGEPCSNLTMTCKLSLSLYACQCAWHSRRRAPGRGYHYSRGADIPSRSILFLKYQNISHDNKQQWLHVHCSSCKDKSVKTFLRKHLMYLIYLVCVCVCVLCVVCVCAHVREHANTCLGLNSASQVHSESSELRGMLLWASLP